MVVATLVGAAVGLAVTVIDHLWLTPPPIELGDVAGVRSLQAAVAGGLITVAVFSLWMRTVVVGLVSGHFSPRTLVTFLDDRFQRRLLGSMGAGVVAVLVMLVGPTLEQGTPAPLLSTVLTVVIAVAALAGVLLAIQHATRSLSLPELISRLANEALEVLGRQPAARVELHETPPAGASTTLVAPDTGWVIEIDVDRMREALPPGGIVHLQTRVGAFVTPRTPLATVSLTDAQGEADLDGVTDAVTLARTRSPDLDLAFAIGQLLDVGVYALHGSTDTATGHEVMLHLGAVLEAVVEQGVPLLHDLDADGRRIHDEAGWDAADHIQLCAERLRKPAADEPEAARHLLHMLRRLHELAVEVDEPAVASEVGRQVEMLLELVDAHGVLPRDRLRLEREARPVVDPS